MTTNFLYVALCEDYISEEYINLFFSSKTEMQQFLSVYSQRYKCERYDVISLEYFFKKGEEYA